MPPGSLGHVNGLSEDESGVCGYGVWVYGLEDGWMFDEENLRSTGKFAKREDIYPGTVLHISQDGEVIGHSRGDPSEEESDEED